MKAAIWIFPDSQNGDLPFIIRGRWPKTDLWRAPTLTNVQGDPVGTQVTYSHFWKAHNCCSASFQLALWVGTPHPQLQARLELYSLCTGLLEEKDPWDRRPCRLFSACAALFCRPFLSLRLWTFPFLGAQRVPSLVTHFWPGYLSTKQGQVSQYFPTLLCPQDTTEVWVF